MIASVQGMFREPRLYTSDNGKINCTITTWPMGESKNYLNRIGVVVSLASLAAKLRFSPMRLAGDVNPENIRFPKTQ